MKPLWSFAVKSCCLFASRGLEVRCRRVASKRYVPLEAHCRHRDVEVFASRDRELGRCAVGVLPLFASRALEVWRCVASVLLKRSGDALQA